MLTTPHVQRLTLRNGMMTRGRRTKPVPQLKCVGGDAKGLYEVDVMIGKNLDSDYGDTEFLGSTDVYCEGYSHSSNPYMLKGSCGVEYRLMLTDAGGWGGWGGWPGDGGGGGGGRWYDPPPPYPGTGPGSYKAPGTTEGWRPGFWSRATAGALGAQLLGRGFSGGERERERDRGGGIYSAEIGSGGRSPGGGGGETTHTSTGFGQTRRR
ncbi:hypothetical protein BDZ91DRAFT_770660 [Kalaharituber pfeilii]|nr:hypothetical protein BDZ91DRAFT_770660 [Kalaharituber pfeilii]